MANVRFNAQDITRDAVAETFQTPLLTADTYLVSNNGSVFLHFKKTGAGANTTTVVTPGSVDGLAIPDKTFNVPATTGDVLAGPWPPGIYNDENGDLKFTVSEVTGLSVAILRL